jgi:uncharacterized membrane protein YadS
VAPIVSAKSEDVSLAISVVAFFTLAFTFIQAYFAIGVGMDENVAGAWIGASVDQTGNVIASAAIISEKATEVAAIIKMVLNSVRRTDRLFFFLTALRSVTSISFLSYLSLSRFRVSASWHPLLHAGGTRAGLKAKKRNHLV